MIGSSPSAPASGGVVVPCVESLGAAQAASTPAGRRFIAGARSLVAMSLAVCLATGCGGERGERADTIGTREADSALGASRVPGASGVSSSMRAADSAAARNARLDSVAPDP